MAERQARLRERWRQQQAERLARVRFEIGNAIGVQSVLDAPDQIDRLVRDETVSAEACGFAIEELAFSNEEHHVRRALETIQSLFDARSRRTTEVWKSLRRERTDAMDAAALSGLGLPAETFLSGWKKAGMEASIRTRELEFLLDLERRDPGSVAFLHQEFGITIFGRYPAGVLLRQRRKVSDTSLPYGIVIAARADHDDAFYHTLKKPIESLDDDLGMDGLVRIIEVENKTELARRLLALNVRYGEKQKIQFALVAGHGEPEYVQLGEVTFGQDKDRQRITIDDLAGRGIRRGKEFFVDRPSIVLASCSTGFEGGIGQKLSEQYDADVTAPEVSTSFLELHATVENGRIRLDGRFENREYGFDQTKRYSSGKESE